MGKIIGTKYALVVDGEVVTVGTLAHCQWAAIKHSAMQFFFGGKEEGVVMICPVGDLNGAYTRWLDKQEGDE